MVLQVLTFVLYSDDTRTMAHIISKLTHDFPLQTTPLVVSSVSAGFPSPAEEAVDVGIDLNRLLIEHPAATFLVRASGTSMVDAGIFEGDLLIVDRSLQPQPGSVVIAYCDDQFLVKRLTKNRDGLYLVAENKKSLFRPLQVTETVVIWGVVSSVIKPLQHTIGAKELR